MTDGAILTTTTVEGNVVIAESSILTTSEIVGDGLVIDGGSLVYDTTGNDTDSSKEHIAIQNVANSITLEQAEENNAGITASTSGDITITSTGNILLLGGDFEVTSGSTLTLNTENEDSVVSVSESSTYTNSDEETSTLVVNSTLSLGADVEFISNVDLELANGAVLEEGSSFNITSSLSTTDDSSTTSITGLGAIAIGEDDGNSTSLNSTIETDLTNVALNGEIESAQSSAIKLIGENTIISGTSFIDSDVAIEIANTSGVVEFADGTSISSSGNVFVNTYDDTDNNMTLIANNSLYIGGGIFVDSTLDIMSGTASEDGATVTVAGGVITTNLEKDGSDSSTITIGEKTNLILAVDSTDTMTIFKDSGAISSQFNAIARAMYAYEMGDESYDFSYGFANGYTDSIDYIGGEAGRNSAVIGLGLSYDFSETCIGYFDYTAYIYESLITHSLNLSIGVKF